MGEKKKLLNVYAPALEPKSKGKGRSLYCATVE